MAERARSALQELLQNVENGSVPATRAWQLTLREGAQGWPADVRELVSLGGDVIAAGNHWIIVTEDLREDILSTARDVVEQPTPVTVVMLDDLPDDVVANPDAMDEIQSISWMTATGDALVIPHGASE